MPKQNARLSRAEEAQYVICLQQLQAEGIDVNIPPELLERHRTLDITVGGSGESLISESRSGQPYYAVWVRLTGHNPATLVDCQMAVPWKDEIVLSEVSESEKLCRHGPELYARDEVLNARITSLLRFRRAGHVVEGWILACGRMRIPQEYRTGMMAGGQISFRDSLGQEFTESRGLRFIGQPS